MFFTTERLRVRPFNVRDTKEYYSLVSSSESIVRYVPFAWKASIDEMYEDITDCYSKGNFKDDFYFILEAKHTRQIVGAIIAVRTQPKVLDLSVLIGENFQQKGYMYEAMQEFILQLKPLGYEFLTMAIESDNEKSLRLFQRLDAQYEKEIEGGKTLIFKLKI